MIDEGHQVGNHTVNHYSMPDISLEKAYSEVMRLDDYMQENFGYKMNLFRFPKGESSERTLGLLQKLGYTSVFWNFAHRDWDINNQPDPEKSKESVMKYTKNGTIYLLHAVSKTDTDILPDIIDDIRAKGFVFGEFPRG